MAGAKEVAEVLRFRAPVFAPLGRRALINGSPGVIIGPPGKVISVAAITVVGGRIREIDIIGDPAKLRRLSLR